MSNTAMTPDQFFDELDKLFGTDDGYENHLKRIKELKEQNDGIMNEEDTQHILGINSYEKFCQAMCELNFDEDLISELKKQNEQLEYELDEEKEEHENTKYDLEKLQGDLEPLDEMMDKIKEVTEYEHVVDYVNGLHQKNLELEESAQSTENYWKSNYENEQSTNKMLNDAIINHSEILDELREYLSRFDGDEVEVFDKIVKGSTD